MKIFLNLTFLVLLVSCSNQWSYSGKTSSQYWGNLDERFKFCKVGYNQSPIDIREKFKNHDLRFEYKISNIEKIPEKYALKIEFFDQSFLFRGKKRYLLRYLDFHHPSEHFVEGEPHSLEMQISHKSEDEQWLILAFFLEVGEENPKFSDLINFLNSKSKETNLDLTKIVKADDEAFFYEGSFTVPPCTEGVKWYVMKTPIKISKEQMNHIINKTIFVKSNAREIQKFNREMF